MEASALPLIATTDIDADSHYEFSSTFTHRHAHAYADSVVTAKIGALHAYAHAAGNAMDAAMNAQSRAYGIWEDEVRIVSNTLANGTPVTLEATLVLDRTVPTGGAFNGPNGSATWSFTVFSAHFYEAFGNSPSFIDSWDDRDTRTTFVQKIETRVGDTLDLWQSAELRTAVNLPYFAHASVAMTLDASNTVKLGLTSLTPGASFTSAGGASYTLSAAVPEPASVIGWGLVIGCAGLAAAKRRFQSRAAALAGP